MALVLQKNLNKTEKNLVQNNVAIEHALEIKSPICSHVKWKMMKNGLTKNLGDGNTIGPKFYRLIEMQCVLNLFYNEWGNGKSLQLAWVTLG